MLKINRLNYFKHLSKKQFILFSISFFGGLLMLINSLYLVFAGHVAKIGEDPELLPITYQLMLIVHVVIGMVFFFFDCFFCHSASKENHSI